MCSVKWASCSLPGGSASEPTGTPALTETLGAPGSRLNQTFTPLARKWVSKPAKGLEGLASGASAAPVSTASPPASWPAPRPAPDSTANASASSPWTNPREATGTGIVNHELHIVNPILQYGEAS